MQQCPRSLYDCNTLETTLSGVADVILMPDFVSSVHGDIAVEEICRFLKTPMCSDAVLAECKGEVVYASGALKSRIQYVCGNRQTRKGMQELKSCFRRFHRHFQHCSTKRKDQLDSLRWYPPSTASPHPWCNLTQDYIMCVYSVMALGCTMEVAEEYMGTVNMSAPVVQAILGYGCSFGHPLDVLRTTSPVSVMTSAPIRAEDPSANRPDYRSGARRMWSGADCLTAVLLLLVLRDCCSANGMILLPVLWLGCLVAVVWNKFCGLFHS
ncbi:hypothetical protein C0Q70_04722 [Pomacea canaliculata]|uniref:Uncharacterized protein n=2 Tax=Pomacea canaliculata TaxID=400727 RepID=A0A2T7PJ58_POMCA|nr:hypothetical protein C0Q70_04722 [Pomacea canaliculata]